MNFSFHYQSISLLNPSCQLLLTNVLHLSCWFGITEYMISLVIIKSWKDVDFVQFLSLDQTLSPAEIEDLTDLLAEEIWYRLTNEELPKLIPEGEYDHLAKNFKETHNPNALMNEVTRLFPTLEVNKVLETITNRVKKDFILRYLQQIMDANDTKWDENLKELGEALATLKNNEFGNFEKVESFLRKY